MRSGGQPVTAPTNRFPSGPRTAEVANAAGAWAWPLTIVAAVLFVLRDVAFQNRLINNTDILSFWLPNYCFMGRTVAAGHVPAWNPSVMGGIPFAADPQTGWMYLPAMLLFSAFPCDVAIRLYIVLLPVIAGLGLYAFMRTEGLSRPASGGAGVMIALLMAGSLVQSIPFSAALAWTAVTLFAVARYVRATTWPARIGWLAASAVAFGQLAAAFLSHGLVLGASAVGLYVAVKVIRQVRAGDRRAADAVMAAGLLVLAVPLVNLAYLVPRMAYLPHTTLGVGYKGLQRLSFELSGRSPPGNRLLLPAIVRYPGVRMASTWPLGLTRSPGAYIGAAAGALSLAAWRARRHVHLAIAFFAYGVVCYLATLPAVADWVNHRFGTWPLVDFYVHDPTAFRYGVVFAIPVLAGLGIEAVAQTRSQRELAALLAPGLVVWWVLPFVLGVEDSPSKVFIFGMAATATMLGIAQDRRRLLAAVLPVIAAVELSTSAWLGQVGDFHGLAGVGVVSYTPTQLTPVLGAPFDVGDYVSQTSISRTLRSLDGGRYLSYLPTVVPDIGYFFFQGPSYWGLLANQRSILLGLEDAQGYSPVQPLRFWEYNQIVTPGKRYSLAFFHPVPAVTRNLFQVAWVVGPADQPPVLASREPPIRMTVVATDGSWALYALPGNPPRASVMTSWRVVGSPDEARRIVTGTSFSPSVQAIVEQDPGIRVSLAFSGHPSATYRSTGPQSAVVEVVSPAPAIVVVRNSYDPRWHATVDGRPARVLPADSVIQGVPVGPGRHEIRLAYDDPTIGWGLTGTILSLVGFLVAIVFARRRERRTPRSETNPPDEVPAIREDRTPLPSL
jgi:hypothetical protein